MVIDSHTHVFSDWPGRPLATRGSPAQLLRTMDAHAADPRAYPHAALQPLVRTLYDSVGPRRLVWGSDSPVVETHMSYGQSLDLFREHTPYISAADKALILGGNLARLLAWPNSK